MPIPIDLKRLLLGAAGGILSAVPVSADFQADDITFTPQVGYSLASGHRSPDSSPLAGLGIDFRISRPLSVEADLGRTL